MKLIQTCTTLSSVPHIPKMSVLQLQTLAVIDSKDGATANEIGFILGYDGNEISKVISRISHTLAKRHPLIFGTRVKNRGRGQPKLWQLTSYGKIVVNQYKLGIL